MSHLALKPTVSEGVDAISNKPDFSPVSVPSGNELTIKKRRAYLSELHRERFVNLPYCRRSD